MADQFCKIVDTNICDMTLGSDATQSVLTTDANTSYVIRDIFKKDSSTDSTKSFKGDLVMDGVSVHEGLTGGAEGSLIVPPSSTLCYKDTSGNYPLLFQCVQFDIFYYGGCTNRTYSRCSFLAPGKNPDAGTLGVVCVGHVENGCCCNCTGSGGGDLKYHPGSCTLTMIYHDSNSTTTVYLQCFNIANGTRTANQTINMSYKTALVTNNEFLEIDSNSHGKVWAFGRCGCTPSNANYCFCTFSGVNHTTYSEGGTSIGGHPCGHIGCVSIFEAHGNGANDTVKQYVIDTCCLCSGVNIKSELLWCMPKCCLPNPLCQYVTASSVVYIMPFYSKTCDAWLTGFYTDTCGLFVYDGTTGNFQCITTSSPLGSVNTSLKTHCLSTLVIGATSECKFGIIDLEDIVRDPSSAKINFLNTPYSSQCYLGHTDRCGCFNCPMALGTLCVTNPTLNSCSYPDIDESTKLVMYGIKSTT